MTAERLRVELRSELQSRTLCGQLFRYGVAYPIAPGITERWERGAANLIEPALMNLEHRASQPLALVEFELDGDGLAIAATLPAGQRQDEALARIERRELTGLSVEFIARRDHWSGGDRTITAADVIGAAVCEGPAYPDALIESRSRRLAGPGRPRRLIWIP